MLFPPPIIDYSAINIKLSHISLEYLAHPTKVSTLQDVVEIMRESLYDKYIDEHGVVDFGRSGGMSQQKEAKRFLSALDKQSELHQKDTFTISVCRSDCFVYFKIIRSHLVTHIHMLYYIISGNIQFGR